MNLLFNRVAAVTFGLKDVAGPPREGQTRVDYNFTRISGLRIAFEIEKNSESPPNTAKISIYNLSNHNWGILQSGEQQVVFVEAGYEGGW